MFKFKPSLHCSSLISKLHTWTGEVAMTLILSTSLMGLGRTKVESGSLCYCIGANIFQSRLLLVTNGPCLNQAGSLRYSGTSRARNTKGEYIRAFLVYHVAVGEVVICTCMGFNTGSLHCSRIGLQFIGRHSEQYEPLFVGADSNKYLLIGEPLGVEYGPTGTRNSCLLSIKRSFCPRN